MALRAAALMLLTFASLAGAGEEEHRTYTVTVGKKICGTNHLVIQKRDDGAVSVVAQADVLVKISIITYRVNYRGAEVWKDDRLQHLTSSTNDNGKKHTVSAEVNKDAIAVKADGKESQVQNDAWVTSYWKLPPEKLRGPNLVLLDAGTGKVVTAKLEKVGVEKITLMGKMTEVVHYRLSGGVQVDLWYDGDDRLVRQESIEEGHRTILELSRLQRE